jgi:hypothetical protein
VNTLATACVVFVCCFGAALAGMALHRKVPDDHLDADSKDVVKLIMGLIATLAALVLGLLIASAKTSYDTQVSELQLATANIVQLDRLLALYGPETQEARVILKRSVALSHDRIWPPEGHQTASPDAKSTPDQGAAFFLKLQNLSPQTDAQRRSQSAALDLASTVAQTRLLMIEQLGGSVSWPLLAAVVFWVSMLFLGFGLFARFHVTAIVSMVVGAACVASAIFLILELSQPYTGTMRISDAPFRDALTQMDR